MKPKDPAPASAHTVKVGDELPPFEKTFTSVDLFAYGAATWDWARAHYDVEFTRSLNFPGPFVDGQHFGALFAQRAMTWLGPKAFITRMKFNFRTMIFIGDTINGSGKVTAITPLPGASIFEMEQKFVKGEDLASSCTMQIRIAS